MLPSALGILAALAVFGWTGTPVTIFTALGLVLVLGLGVDYGIFLTGSPSDGSFLLDCWFFPLRLHSVLSALPCWRGKALFGQ